MRWSLCALLLLLICPSLAFAQLTVVFTSPDPNTPPVKLTGNSFSGAVTNATGTPTVAVNGVAATVTADGVVPNKFEFTATSVPVVFGPNKFFATATDDVTPVPVSSQELDADVSFLIEATEPNAPTIDTGGRTGVRFSGSVLADANAFPADADPNNITVSLGVLPTLPAIELEPNFAFTKFLVVGAGSSAVLLGASDPNNNLYGLHFTVTRTVVCDDNPNDPNFPQAVTPDPTLKGVAFSYSVDRSDDLPNGEPNAVTCDVRPLSVPSLSFTPPVGHCPLRAAIQASNAHHLADDTAKGDRIFVGPRHIVLRERGAHEDAALTGDLDIHQSMRIIGNGRDVTEIDARGLGDRVFDVAAGVNLQLFDLTVIGGQTPKAGSSPDPNDPNTPERERGGCIRDEGNFLANNTALLSCGAADDGGVLAQIGGSAKLTCTIVARGKTKTNGGGVAGADGAQLDIRNSTLSLNSAGASGGAIWHEAPGLSMSFTNDTLTGNSAKTGGALDLDSGDTVTVNNCTFSGNTAKAGATLSGGADVTIANSILGDISKTACDPNAPEVITSGGGNVERLDSCLKTPGSFDLVNTNAKLGGLASNNATQNSALPPTQRLLMGSPAIDFAGVETPCTPLDARDTERYDWPGVGHSDPDNTFPAPCDSGAFELTAPNADPP